MTRLVLIIAVATNLVFDVAPASAGMIVLDDAVAWWRMDSNTNDSNAPPASNGTVHGDVGYVAVPGAGFRGNNGVAASFDGNDYIEFATGGGSELYGNFSDGLTVFGRIDPTLDSASHGNVLNQDGYSGGVRCWNLEASRTSGGRITWRVWLGGTSYQIGLTGVSDLYNQPGLHDVVGVFRPGAAIEIYLDGTRVSYRTTGIPTYLDASSTVPVVIGRRAGGVAPAYYDGLIESAAIWNRPLSANEIFGLSVPEPTTIFLFGIGLIAMMFQRRRR